MTDPYQVEAACGRMGIGVRPIPRGDVAVLRRDVVRAFCEDSTGPLWERIDSRGVQDRWASLRLCSWLPGSTVLFFDERRSRLAFEFASGPELAVVLGELVLSDYYVTDLDASFLLAFNHHDFVIGGGKAEAWV